MMPLAPEAMKALTESHDNLIKAVRLLLMCSLPRDASGERMVAEARCYLKEALALVAKKGVAMIEIKPGAELDRAVAEAVGLTWPVVERPERRVVGLYEVIPGNAVKVGARDDLVTDAMIPNYSTDLNAAFAAAEKVGLFDKYRLGRLNNGDWELVLNCDCPMEDEFIACERTPTLAMCAAILELKEA